MRLSEITSVGNQFQRSINVSSDYQNDQILSEFVVTPLCVNLFSRLISGLSGDSKQAAWSITGPYGGGKSANLLFIMQVLGKSDTDFIQNKLRTEAPQLFNSVNEVIDLSKTKVFFIPVVGSREPIVISILKALSTQIDISNLENSSEYLEQIKSQLAEFQAGQNVNEENFMSMFTAFVSDVEMKNTGYSKVVIIFDELGISLEFASQQVELNDIGILQTLAEYANRSKGTFSLITVLHQAFDQYAQTLNPLKQQEWSKIQGRFEDIAFLESTGELLNLMQKAIKFSPKKNFLRINLREKVIPAKRLEILPNEIPQESGIIMLQGCIPLHPIVSLLLCRMFRSRFAQNERSLFAFLGSNEPLGFQDYINTTEISDGSFSLYDLPFLYDYLSSSFGGSLFTNADGKKWAEIEDAIDRLPVNASDDDFRLIKAIGLLEMFGDQNTIKASPELLAYSLDLEVDRVRDRLEWLENNNVIVYREFKKAYGFWQGSDINLQEEFNNAISRLDRSIDLSVYIKEFHPIKPYLAKRHLFQTGTFRFFKPIVVNLDRLLDIETNELVNPGGGILLVVIQGQSKDNTESIRLLQEFSNALHPTVQQHLLIMFPDSLHGLQEAMIELKAWENVRLKVPELEGDRIARKELLASQLAAQRRMEDLIRSTFDLASAYKNAIWFYKSQQLNFKTARDLSRKFSEIFDEVYSSAPIVQNELINRNWLTGAATAGRNALMKGLVEQPHFENLGMEGYPPQMSMYLSVVKECGLHYEENGKWKLGLDPNSDDPHNIKPMWEGIWNFLYSNWAAPINLTELYKFLQKAPYGVSEGLLPVYCVIAFSQWESQIALYEENSYVPELTTAVVERLMKVPERFKVQLYPMDKTRSKLLHSYTKIFRPEIDPAKVSIISAIQPIMEFIHRLPNYACYTNSLKKETVELREKIFTAKNPQQLLLSTIPGVYGHDFSSEEMDVETIERFFDELNRSLLELGTAYEVLIEKIRSEISKHLLLPDDIQMAREEISSRAELLLNWVDELSLKAFIVRLKDQQLNDRKWLESIAASITNKPPKNWKDQDISRFLLKIREYSNQFRRVEEVVLYDKEKKQVYNKKDSKLRLGITDSSGRELKRILYISEDDQIRTKEIQRVIEESLIEFSEVYDLKVYALLKVLEQHIKEESKGDHNGEDPKS